jgi:phytoene synthase
MNSKEVFAKGSKTYYNASKFFPKNTRKEVTTCYAFVRIVDDFVDDIPPKPKEFNKWDALWQQSWNGKKSNIQTIDNFVFLAKKKGFEKEWVTSFFKSMRFDLDNEICKNKQDSIDYMYGSAEVIGLMMAKILNLSKESLPYAGVLGRSMQYINFIRDIDEDNNLKRRYLPGSYSLNPKTIKQKNKFITQIRKEIQQYYVWEKKGSKGYKFISYAPRVAIMTASDMYKWTAHKIEKNPLVVFERKVKPSKTRILFTGLKNCIKAYFV